MLGLDDCTIVTHNVAHLQRPQPLKIADTLTSHHHPYRGSHPHEVSADLACVGFIVRSRYG